TGAQSSYARCGAERKRLLDDLLERRIEIGGDARRDTLHLASHALGNAAKGLDDDGQPAAFAHVAPGGDGAPAVENDALDVAGDAKDLLVMRGRHQPALVFVRQQ